MKSLLNGISGRIGEPEGQSRLLNPSRVEEAVAWVENNQQSIEQNIILSTGTTVDHAQVSDTGTIVYDSGITSVSRVAEGVYDVTTDRSFAVASSGKWKAVAVVSPESVPTDTGTATTNEYLGLHTISVDKQQSGVQFDSQTGQLWATDQNSQALGIAASGFPYVSPDTTGSDRIAVYKIDSDTWRYIYLPDLWEINYLQAGEMLMLNVPERVAYVQAAGTSGSAKDGKRTTLVYDLDSLELLQNTHDDKDTSTGQCIIIGWDNTNDRIITSGGTKTAMWNMTNGYLGTEIDSDPNFYAVTKRLFCDAAGKFWFPQGDHPSDWRRWYLVASVLTTDTVDAGTDGISDAGIWAYDDTNDIVYYMDRDELKLLKIACSTGTRTSIATYSAVTSGNHSTEASGIYALEMSADDSRLLGIRGGTSGAATACFYIIDPSDGSIDFHYDLPSTHTDNWGTQNVAVDYGVLWSIGSKRIMEVRFAGAEVDTALTIYDPVFHAVRFTAANKVRVQFFKGNNYRVAQDSAFHIHIVGTEA